MSKLHLQSLFQVENKEKCEVILDLRRHDEINCQDPSVWRYWSSLDAVQDIKQQLLRFVRNDVLNDPRFYKRKTARGFWEAGAIAYGHRTNLTSVCH